MAIPPSDSGSGSTGSDGDSSSPSSGLSGGAIAGIVIGALLLVAAVIIIVLRLRRKWLGVGFADAAAAKKPPPDESILEGPVFNAPLARHGSSPDSSIVPYSAADVSAAGSGSGPRSTAEHARQGSRSTVGDGAAGAVAGSSWSGTPPKGGGNATLLDPPVRPGTAELDGNEIRGPLLPAVAENSTRVFELPGSAPPPVPVGDGGRRTMETDRGGPDSLGSLRSSEEATEGGKRVAGRTPSPPTATSEVNPAAFGRHSLVSNP